MSPTWLAATVALLCTSSALAQQRPAPAPDERVQTRNGVLRLEHLGTLDNPWGMAFLPDGRLLITEKSGVLRIYDGKTISGAIPGVPKVAFRKQTGLADVEVDPDFRRNGFIYLSYAEAADQAPGTSDPGDPRLDKFNDFGDNVVKGGAVARARLAGGALRDVKVIWRQDRKTLGRGHVAGRLLFGPDGKLYITSGERMRFDPAQDLGSNLGKVVRINADGSVPRDNPFAGRRGARGDVWSYGHRNPNGIAFHPRTGRLWLHEFGPKGGDEFNIVERGTNYGWPIVNDSRNYDDSPNAPHASRPDMKAPARVWTPVISPSGLLFYSGKLMGWPEDAIIGGLSSKALIRLTMDGDRVTAEERIPMGRRIRDVIEAPDGALLVLVDGDDGELLRLTPARR